MFHPDEVIFAPTGQCNLSCLHCGVSRPSATLPAAAAIAFLEECGTGGIEKVGFSGGEPFLEPDFLCEVSQAAVGLGMLFDRLMTNAVWFKDEAGLKAILGRLFEAGFDGKFGVSVDSWHEQDIDKLLLFIASVFEIWGRRDCVDILSVRAPDEGAALEKLASIARRFSGELILEKGEPAMICDNGFEARLATGEDIPEALSIDVYRFPCSAPAHAGSWKAEAWFVDDFCEGPGNVLYVHPNGAVAACCGFANENPSLLLGRIGIDGLSAMMANAASNPQVVACYQTGLGKTRTLLEAAGTVFPGKTDDQCFFCDWLCAKSLIGKG